MKVDKIKGFIGTSPNSTLFLIECQNGKDVLESTCFPTGRGICNYSNGYKYNEDWVNGAKEGRGKFIWGKDGAQWYEGDFRNDNMNEQNYDGEFRDGQLHGQGTVIDSNGQTLGK
ncbi:unnamed protein product, partial [Adineta steineri]